MGDQNAQFLDGVTLRPVTLPPGSNLRAVGLALGQGTSALEVLVARTDTPPNLPRVRSAWKARQGGRAAPLMLIILHRDKATYCGPAGEDPPAIGNVDPGQIERICREALEQPDRHAALRCLRDMLPSIETKLPGVRNEGFLATHELEAGAPGLAAWESAGEKARAILAQRGEDLLRSLGFGIEPHDSVTSILRIGDRKSAVAVLLRRNESPEHQVERFSGLSPVSYALAVADRENAPYVLVSQDSKLRLYPVSRKGVGQRGRTETYVEVHTGLLRDADAAYLWLLFSAEALTDGGTLDQLMAESKRFAGELAENLRDRVYRFVVPVLAQGLAHARGLEKPTAKDLADTYEMAMTVLFRLLFIAYAEDKDLLPFRWNGLYRARSLKTKALELRDRVRDAGGDEIDWDPGDDLWQEVNRLFRAVEKGHREWGVPEYDGGLFSTDPQASRVGALLAEVSLPNSVMGPVLRDLLLIGSPEGLGPVDFRSLGVREFGTIYEGLLESELAVAETDLVTDTIDKKKDVYRPAKDDEEPIVPRGHVYLHNKSGQRKATGSYFTKDFAVEHLLDHALEPGLDDHLARLDALDDDEAGERFFDFRVADIAMGSGHFLVSAVDHIERRFSEYLSRRQLPAVRQELARLRVSAEKELDKHALKETLAEGIEDTQLLRRLIARRCIYGVDINPVSVDLARLSIWIHTFVPGLPLSLLDHNLICGNSLVGIGQVCELTDIANADGETLFTLDLESLVGEATEPLKKLAQIADATATEVSRARKAHAMARAAVAPAEALCDIATDSRMRGESLPLDLGKWEEARKTIVGSRAHKAARKRLADLSPLHFPVAFPEVFLRDRAGFDVILGNPPWEEATVEEDRFWNMYVPGLQAMPQREQERLKQEMRTSRPDLVREFQCAESASTKLREILLTGPFPGMGTGDPDLYKAFSWRFWHLVSAKAGRLGVVLPRSALTTKGSAQFRKEMFQNADPVDITTLINRAAWVFDGAEKRYTIGLVAICRRKASGKSVRLRGPFASFDRFNTGIGNPPAEFSAHDVTGWTDTAALPLLPTEESLAIFAQLRKAPRLDLKEPDKWRARPHRELDATNDKHLMDLKSESCPSGFWPVYNGESFDHWQPDAGIYYAWGDPDALIAHLQLKRLRGRRRRNSVWFEFAEQPTQWFDSIETLPCQSPRIAFKDLVRYTDSRTVKVCLLPPRVFATNTVPYILWPRGDETDEAFLLGVLGALPLDWYARRFVELHLNFHILNPFPIPRPADDDSLRHRVIKLAGRLACPDDRFADWAKAVGVECGPLAADTRLDMICELDAVVAHLYGLTRKHLVHIFETFHVGWEPGTTARHPTLGEYDTRLARTLEHYRASANKR